MHISLPIVSIATLLHSADYPKPQFDVRRAQTKMIRHAFNDFAAGIARGVADTSADICAWEAIDCTDGLVTTICLRAQRISDGAKSHSEWIPPTVEFIHWRNIGISNEAALTYLPRELRYLFWAFCDDKTPSIDCERLPQRMEEFILVHSTFSGEIRFSKMPQTMRYVHIQQSPVFTKVITINYNTLPASLEDIRVTSSHDDHKMKGKVRAIGKPGAVRLRTKYDRRHPKKGSKYLAALEKRKR